MLESLILVLFAAIGAFFVTMVVRHILRRHRAIETEQTPELPVNVSGQVRMQPDVIDDPRHIRVGDLVDCSDLGTNLAVLGIIHLDEDGDRWMECYLEPELGTDVRTYLSVEVVVGELTTTIWRSVRGVHLTPGPLVVEYLGQRYELDEEDGVGQARYTSVGITDVHEDGRCRYWDYRSPGGDLLSFEQYDNGRIEVSTGIIVPMPHIYRPTQP